MVQTLFTNYTFKYPFELVSKVYFNKYNSGQDKNVKEIKIISFHKDKNSGIEYFKRQGKCADVVPSYLKLFFNEPNIYFEEEIWMNWREKTMSMKTRNLSYRDYAKLQEKSIYKVSKENPKWTSFEQEGKIDVHGLGPFLNTFTERFCAVFLAKGGEKGLNIMENLLKQARCIT